MAVKELEKQMFTENANLKVVTDALRWMSDIDGNAAHHARLAILKRTLGSNDTSIRDASSIEIEIMDDPGATGGVEKVMLAAKYVLLW